MTREARLDIALSIRKLPMDERSFPTTQTIDVANIGGPTPGTILVDTAGTNIDLSQLTTPGLCWMQNLDAANYVEYGMWDASTSHFEPLGEIGPGEFYCIKLSRNLGLEYGAGTASAGSGNSLRLRANTAACKVKINAYER